MSSTGGNIQQTYALLQRMYELMQQIETQGQKTEKQVTANINNMRQLETAAMRYLLIARRMGLPDEIDRAVNLVSRMILITRQLEQTIILAQAALAGAGPVGWIVLGASAGYTALSFYSLGG